MSACSTDIDSNTDVTPPAITLNVSGTVTLFDGDEYVEAGAVALDDRDGELSVTVSGEVGSEAGTYIITYTATDSAGNTTQVTLEVVVISGEFDLFAASTARIVSEMTLEQKVGQMIQPEIAYISLDDITKYGIGSVLNGGGSHPYGDRAASPETWLQFARELREASLRPSTSSLGVPVIWGTDAVHGHNNLRGATIFPHNIGLGAINDPDLIGEIATATAREVGATRLDLCTDSRSGKGLSMGSNL